jgi:hypothetical protein
LWKAIETCEIYVEAKGEKDFVSIRDDERFNTLVG